MDGQLLGIIWVPLSHLRFREDLAAGECNSQISQYPEPEIRENPQPDDCCNSVEGIVDDTSLWLVLADLGFSLEQLNATLQSNQYPCLQSRVVEYIYGQHRIKAAKALLGEHAWWAVKLYWFCNLSYAYLSQSAYITAKAEQYAYKTKYCDGYVYLKIREYEDKDNNVEVSNWKRRLTPCEVGALEMIEKRKNIRHALDLLRPFKGLWPDLDLGNYYKEHFSLGCDREIEWYLNHIYHKLSAMTGTNTILASYFDRDSIQILEGRAPCASANDRELIEKAFYKGQLFKEVSDPGWRSFLKKKVLETKGVIPSFKTFNENMKYFSIAVRIIRNLIFPAEFRARRKHLEGRRRSKTERSAPILSFSEALFKCWVPPQDPVVEISEGEFQPLAKPASFNLMKTELILSTLRRFPYLNTKFGPKRDGSNEIVPLENPGCKTLFYRRARRLGFRNSVIEEGAAMAAEGSPISVDEPGDVDLFVKKYRRMGRPYTRSFLVIQQVGFLPQLVSQPAVAGHLSVAYVLKDFIEAFLGPFELELDWQRKCISLNYYMVENSPMGQAALGDGRNRLPLIQLEPVDVDMVTQPETEDTYMEGSIFDEAME